VPDKDYESSCSRRSWWRSTRGHRERTASAGQHDGIEFYTIGQRKGLGAERAEAGNVIELDAARNRVVVGDESLWTG